MALNYYIKGGGYVRGPLTVTEAVDHVATGNVEAWYEIAEVDPGVKPKKNHYAPANTTALWAHKDGASPEQHARVLAERERHDQIVLTTESAPALPIVERLGIITAECAYGMNLLKDFMTGLTDIVGGRSGSTQNVLRDAKDAALAELRRQAYEMEADAVVAVDLDYTEFSGGGKSMWVCIASGTAVKLRDSYPEHKPDNLPLQAAPLATGLGSALLTARRLTEAHPCQAWRRQSTCGRYKTS